MPNRRIAKKKAEAEAVKLPEVVEKEEEKKETEAAVSGEDKAAEEEKEMKKVGRKPGSKNKPKETKSETAVSETENKNVVYVEAAGKQYKVDDVVEKVHKAWVADGHRISTIKSLNVYINMDERMAYYVINDKNTGSVEM